MALSVYLCWSRDPDMPLGMVLLSLGIVWLGLLPTIYYILDDFHPPMPFFPLIGIFYIVFFGIPAFSYQTFRWGEPTNINFDSVIILFTGIFFCFTSYFIFKNFAFHNVNSIRLPRSHSTSRLIFLLWILLLGHLTYDFIPIIRSIPSLGKFIDPAGYLAFGMFYILWKRGDLSGWQKYLLAFIIIPLYVMRCLATGALYQIMYFVLFIGIVSVYYHKKIQIIFASTICIFYLLFNPVKMEYRSIVRGVDQDKSLSSVVNNSALFLSLAYEYVDSMGYSSDFSVSQKDSMARINHIFEFAAVIDETPNRIPYWGGETYKPLITMFIPRIIWQNKPEEKVGQSFGHRYGFINPTDDVTSWNLPWITEMYANYGSVGVVLGMTLVGCLLAFLEAKLNRPGMIPLEFVVGATILLPLVFQESNFSNMAGNILLLYISFYIYFVVGLRVRLGHNSGNGK
jgi:hypothetical protein